jgi:SAM-dependent methyltransferase
MTNFNELIADHTRVSSLLTGSHYGSTFGQWCSARRFISKTLKGCGSILDVGCANGFLLRCILEWCNYEITPYGIDIDRNLLEQARVLLDPYQEHLAELSLYNLDTLEVVGLPISFTYVYWNVWDNFWFDNDRQKDAALRAAAAVSTGGRLIIGFYDRNPKDIELKIERIQLLLGTPSGRIDNGPRREVAVWFDR